MKCPMHEEVILPWWYNVRYEEINSWYSVYMKTDRVVYKGKHTFICCIDIDYI